MPDSVHMKKVTFLVLIVLAGSFRAGQAYAAGSLRCGSRLISITDGDYGFDARRGNELRAREGDAKAVVWLKDGPPVEMQRKNAFDISVQRSEDEDFLYVEKHFIPVLDEEWVYDPGPGKNHQRLIFENNSLARIVALKT